MLNIKNNLRRIALAALFLIAALTPAVRAQTLDIYVDSTTWAYDNHQVSSPGYTSFSEYYVTGTVPPYNTSETRRYYGGYFDVVNVRNKNSPHAVIQTISPCNNLCYIKGTQLYSLSNGYNGSGNGVNGPIATAAAFANGDLYVGGSFTIAGGYSHSAYFSCFRFNEGWSGVNEVQLDGPVSNFSWSNYKLHVTGSFDTAYGPTTSGGSIYSSISVTDSVYWNDYYKTFPNGWWTSN